MEASRTYPLKSYKRSTLVVKNNQGFLNGLDVGEKGSISCILKVTGKKLVMDIEGNERVVLVVRMIKGEKLNDKLVRQ